MKKIYYKPILLFLLSCFLIIPAFAIFSSIFVMIMSIMGMLGTKYGSHIFIYLSYFFIIDLVFYGSSKKQNQYISSLDKDKVYTWVQDAKLFLKQEGIVVMITYALYAIVAFIAKEYIPQTNNTILNILKLGYTVPIFPSSIFSLPIWLEYLLCLVCFSILYCFVMIWHRAKIRKVWHK